MDSADAPIRYRVARELLNDEQAAKNIESELLANKEVQKWLIMLEPEIPVHYSIGYLEHGSFDFCLENSLTKLTQLGMRGGIARLIEAEDHYIKQSSITYSDNKYERYSGFGTPNLLLMAGIKDEIALKCLSGRLNRLYEFARTGN